MHKVLMAATLLGLLGLPMLASAQSNNQPSTKKESAADPGTPANKAAKAYPTKQAAKPGSNKHAQISKKKRLATHHHNMPHVKANHGKRFAKSNGRHRFAKSNGRHRQASAARRMHQASAKSRAKDVRGAVINGGTSMRRRAAYQAESAPMQRNCGEFMYWKNGKCNDARNKPAK
jgi:hypothetical protein